MATKAKKRRKIRNCTEEENEACARASLVAMREVLLSDGWEVDMVRPDRIDLYLRALAAGEAAEKAARPEDCDYSNVDNLHVLATAIFTIGWEDESFEACHPYAVGAQPWLDLLAFFHLYEAAYRLGGALDIGKGDNEFLSVVEAGRALDLLRQKKAER